MSDGGELKEKVRAFEVKSEGRSRRAVRLARSLAWSGRFGE